MDEDREEESELEDEEVESGGETWQPDLSNLSEAEEMTGTRGKQPDYNTRGNLFNIPKIGKGGICEIYVDTYVYMGNVKL